MPHYENMDTPMSFHDKMKMCLVEAAVNSAFIHSCKLP